MSVLPVWPGKAQGGSGAPPGSAPEGSGVVVAEGGLIATAWHVIEPAERIDVRLADGRILPASHVGHDQASDIALLRVDAALPTLRLAPRPNLADPVCAIGNVYGLGLSVSCGVVSAQDVSSAGFNTIEDFVQTDAAANPGSSGGALVDAEGRLVGMVSAIFASSGDSNIGVNFAVSTRLLMRVVDDLRDDGRVDYVAPDWRLARPSREQLAETAGARVVELGAGGAAEAAGIRTGDLILQIGERRILDPRDAIGALALVPPGASVEVILQRNGQRREVTLSFGEAEEADTAERATPTGGPDCPHPKPVCEVRQAVFPVESFDPAASAVRVAPDLLVTNRHVIGNRHDAIVYTPAGPRKAEVIASAYRGDLALLQIAGLPEDGLILAPESGADTALDQGPYFVVGADVARREIRVFEPGSLILGPAEGASLGRIHVTARMQPGVSGGALVDESGRLVGIAVGGGEGRYEALPAAAIAALLAGREAADAASVQFELGEALVRCATAVDTARRTTRGQAYGDDVTAVLADDCRASENVGQYLEAGRLLAVAGAFEGAIALHQAAVEQVPNSVNARISLLVSLQLAARYQDMLPHARWLLEALPDDPQAHRFAIQAGIWGGDPELAEAAYQRLLTVDPRQAQAARRFIDQPPPAPQPR
ncbi:MAG: trypsin-like peptidase domain-containing protein [Kiloniellales bacterium]